MAAKYNDDVDDYVDEYVKHELDFRKLIEESQDLIKNFCENLRFGININVESILQKLFQQKDVLFNRINMYENDCSNYSVCLANDAKEFLDENSNTKNIDLIKQKRKTYRDALFKDKTFIYKESNLDVRLIIGKLIEKKYKTETNKLNIIKYFFEEESIPVFQYSMNIEEIGFQIPNNNNNNNNINEIETDHFIISFNQSHFVMCLIMPTEFQIRLFHKYGDLIQMHVFQPPSIYLSFCANRTCIFLLVKQDNITLLFEFDEYLVLRRVREVDKKCFRIACDDDYVFLLVEKSGEFLCGYFFEIFTYSIQEIQRGSFKTVKLNNPYINRRYYLSPECIVEISSQEENIYVFYINQHTKIEIFAKDKLQSGIIHLNHRVFPWEIFFINIDNIFRIFYIYNNFFYLVDKDGNRIKQRELNGLKNTDKFCVTKDGSLIIASKELNISVYKLYN